MSKKSDIKHYQNICLDEIEHCIEVLDTKKVSNTKRKLLEGWIRKQKIRLKDELGHKGKMPRRKRKCQ